jgi:hypothetical protein
MKKKEEAKLKKKNQRDRSVNVITIPKFFSVELTRQVTHAMPRACLNFFKTKK